MIHDTCGQSVAHPWETAADLFLPLEQKEEKSQGLRQKQVAADDYGKNFQLKQLSSITFSCSSVQLL